MYFKQFIVVVCLLTKIHISLSSSRNLKKISIKSPYEEVYYSINKSTSSNINTLQGKNYHTNKLKTSTGNILPVHKIYKPGFSVTIQHRCPEKGRNLKLLIIILSNPVNYSVRMSIRETWGQFGKRDDIRVIFLLGAHTDSWLEVKLIEEQKDCDDIIRAHSLDSFTNVSLKTIAALEWVDTFCSKVKFILKMNDDVFLNIPQLLTFVKTHVNYYQSIFAQLILNNTNDFTMYNNFNLDELSSELFNFSISLVGHTYMMTNDTVRLLFDKALKRNMLQIEDNFLTGIIAKLMKIKRINVTNFVCRQEEIETCNLHKCISINNIKSNQQYYIWEKLFFCHSNCSYQCYRSSGMLIMLNKNIFIFVISLYTVNICKKNYSPIGITLNL